MMKRCLMLIALIVFFPVLQGQVLAQNRLLIDQTRLDFGIMKEGLIAQKIVNLTNAGDTIIAIKNVSTS
ncbi:MAG: hypothetical protein DRH93_14775 [Deltaproteobacteria bacterium]|nr:MAG: hypothetical protein DRH93_14775 [Deltaproteobacteria bacterium]